MVRFLCGLLSDSSLRVLYILYKYHPNTPVTMMNMPMCYHFYYPIISGMHSIMGWTEFTEKYLSLSALLFEASFDSNNDTFPCFRTFDSATPSNEWECFVKSLLLLHSVHLIYLDQGSANSGPRARCGPRGDFIRPSTLSEIILLFRLFQI